MYREIYAMYIYIYIYTHDVYIYIYIHTCIVLIIRVYNEVVDAGASVELVCPSAPGKGRLSYMIVDTIWV